MTALEKPVSGPLRQAAGYLKSIAQLRQTRLSLASLQEEQQRLAAGLKAVEARTEHHLNPLRKAIEVHLQSVLLYRAEHVRRRPFDARQIIDALPPHARVLSNVNKVDIDGGNRENLKAILQTCQIGQQFRTGCDLALIVMQRVHRISYWDCLAAAQFHNIPLLFAEPTLFGGFAAHFDEDATPAMRQPIGFILDDMGFYFDCRQPSRMEAILNDADFALSDAERERARKLRRQILRDRLTKHNKYVPEKRPAALDVEQGAVVVLDQKRFDASIECGGADNDSFDRMLEVALMENPDQSIYLKQHPDNILLERGWQGELTDPRLRIVPQEVSAPDLLDRADKIYTVTSQAGFEALLRGKEVIVFGRPFYAGWGLTDDRVHVPRRSQQRTVEDLLHTACIRLSVYVDPKSGRLIEAEDAFGLLRSMRCPARPNVALT
jgi:hypothetical protein